ncbi:Stalked cell differentiation-controlling protein [Thiorhodovibrio winogradskyi]|uniref:diguanylate cyclase n=1 Tax=Thiorhodovibrio winogradskyi TaxID=77007 RepID=A0ABZ0S3H8_9GAMM|nr:GGDEF domain-containing protein [Thiorhodovibrio winogradskyi]
MNAVTEAIEPHASAIDIDQAARARRDQGESNSKRQVNARIRAAWLICLLLIACIIAAGTAQLSASHRLAIASATERATAKSFLVAEWVAKSFDLPGYVLQDTVKRFRPDELVYPTNNADLHERKTEMIVDKAASVPNLLFLGMLNADCVITHTSIGTNLGLDALERGREYCALAHREPVEDFKVSNMFTAVTKAMNVTASMPLLSPTGKLEGFALAGLDLGFFQQWLDLVELEPHNVIAIFDLNSRLLARKPLVAGQIGQPVEEEKLNALARSGAEALFTHRIVSPVDGIDRIWSLRKIRNLPFIVVVGEETSTALATWRQQLLLYLVGGTVLCLSFIFGAWEYIRNVRDAATMRELATTDPLTGLSNRRHFIEVAEHDLARTQRTAAPLTLILADLDYFKRINDNYGHQTGDRVLRDVASVLNDLSRKSDLIARWGGEEFVILLPGAARAGAMAFAERLRQLIATLESVPGQAVTLSQGLTAYRQGDSLDSLLKRADTALYRAKHRGRDCIDAE